jgi:hypothetical protein
MEMVVCFYYSRRQTADGRRQTADYGQPTTDDGTNVDHCTGKKFNAKAQRGKEKKRRRDKESEKFPPSLFLSLTSSLCILCAFAPLH